MSHMPGRRNDRLGHARSAKPAIATVIPCLVGQEMTPPIFQAGHEAILRQMRHWRDYHVDTQLLWGARIALGF